MVGGKLRARSNGEAYYEHGSPCVTVCAEWRESAEEVEVVSQGDI